MGEIQAAQRVFVVSTTPERVWDLIGRAIFDSLQGMGKIKVIDENNFSAELKMKVVGIIPVTLQVRGEMIDVSPPDSLGVKLTMKSFVNLLNMTQRVTFLTKSVEENRTEVTCKAYADGLNPAVGWAAKGQVKKEAGKIFETIEERLNQWI